MARLVITMFQRRSMTSAGNGSVEIQHVLADGDRVMMHSRRWLPGAEPGIVVVDIWRLHNGLIAEAWEIIEPVAQAAANLTWWEPADR
ncbi:nuclear transport factor 2 family protein [Streptosporangium sp. NPDC002544]|uniref:nuclear transport factor 2 family protein n=1 Tax=unclassified Streptosporangium TaxID=2632669 RepID=UPI0033211C72